MRPSLFSPIGRVGIRPDEPDEGPDAITGPRPRGSRRPHTDAKVGAVRRLIEDSTLTYGEIARRTGVGRASICRWTRDGAWQRPAFAPRATDTVPRPRAGQKLKLRRLAERLRELAERHVRELEEAALVDPDKLMQALEVLTMARLAAMSRKRRPRSIVGRPETGREWMTRQDAIRATLKELHRGGVTVDRAPQEALDLVIEANLPVDDHPALHPRGRRRR